MDVRASLHVGSYHDVDSSEMAFKIAGRWRYGAAAQGGLALLEPIMEVEVATPEEFVGAVIGDLSSGMAHRGDGTRGGPRRGAGASAAGGAVRLHYGPPFADPRSRDVHHAVRLVPASTRVDRRRRSSSECAASRRATASAPPIQSTSTEKNQEQALTTAKQKFERTSRISTSGRWVILIMGRRR